MPSHPRISELLVETGAYRDLDKPVILTSGLLGVYYINSEKLVQDGGKFAEYGNDSQAMIEHACRMAEEHPTFDEVIDILWDAVEDGFQERRTPPELRMISGGQRRDWLFSGPVAMRCGYPHLSLYKDGHLYVLDHGEKRQPKKGSYAGHVSDLLTKGSSTLDMRKNPPTGWVPMMWDAGLRVSNFYAVVSRRQGGEEVLARAGLDAVSLVQIDEAFLREHSKQPEVAIDYVRKGAEQWGMEYLERNGIENFVDAMSPAAFAKDDRAAKFLAVYDKTLRSRGMRESLREKVQEKYGFDIDLLPSSFAPQEE